MTYDPDLARLERGGLADALLAAGPDAPTLCEGWTARDLAAHVVVRDRRPDTLPGAVVRALSRWTDLVRDRQARAPWAELVDLVRQGPPFWSPTSLAAVDRAVNSLEMYVHHEDVRRGGAGWEPRRLDDAVERALWDMVRHPARLAYRRSRTGVLLRAVLRDGTLVGELEASAGEPRTVLEGLPSELVLHAFGRRGAARLSREWPAPSEPRPR